MKIESVFKEIENLNLEDKELKVKELIQKTFDYFTSNSGEEKKEWEWVKTEYCEMFKKKNHERGGRIKESTLRMKKMFAVNPHIRKEDVIETTKLYLSRTDDRYIMMPHYFLKKGVGNNTTYEFLNWYEIYIKNKEISTGRKDKSNLMQ